MKSSQRYELYNLWWPRTMEPAARELEMIKNGGSFKKKDGTMAGNGLFYHFKKFQEIVWPETVWNRWRDIQTEQWLQHTYMGVLGCAASGKSDGSASDACTDWYAFPSCTTTLVSSTDMKSLELRVWGMIKKYHRLAKERFPWLPGHLVESRQMIVLDHKSEASEGRDFKNGIIGVPTKRGTTFVGLGPLIGIHNKRVRLFADELQLMPRAFLDATSNLSKCEDFKMRGNGNPNETTNAHGILCEPATELGGWESGIDQQGKTKTWRTNFPNGIALQLPGSDSPNMDVSEGEPVPFPFLMTRQQMKDDAKIWGSEDWHFAMMNDARMPRGQGSRRVITRQSCERFGALLGPHWRDSRRTSIAFLDAAYRGTGGDRCVFGELQFGYESSPDITPAASIVPVTVNQNHNYPQGRQIIALIDLITIPIKDDGPNEAEDQIVNFVMKECANRTIEPDHFFYDAGMKTSLVSAFGRLWSTAVQTVDCGGAPSEAAVSTEITTQCNKYYSKFITELWYSVRYAIEARQFRGLTKEAMWEFCAREWKMTPGNKVEVESKVEMKEKTGRSPDLADAVAVGLYGARRLGFIISKMSPPPTARRGPDWRTTVQERSKSFWKHGALDFSVK